VEPDLVVFRMIWISGWTWRQYGVRRLVGSAVWRLPAHEYQVEAPDARCEPNHLTLHRVRTEDVTSGSGQLGAARWHKGRALIEARRRSVALEEHCDPLTTANAQADEPELMVLAFHLMKKLGHEDRP